MIEPAALPPWVHRVRPQLRDAEVLGRRGATPHVVAGATPSGRFVLKHYEASEGPATVTVMRRLRQALARRGEARLAVPVVMRFDHATRVMIQREAPGRPLLPVLQGRGRERGLAAAADALAALHGCRTRLGPVTAMADHIADLIHPHPRVVARALPDEGPRIRAVLTALLAHTEAPAAVTPIHRDAHARQMLLDGRQLWLVDWDLAAMGDPALDVANFAVYLRTHLDGGEAAAGRFLERYLRHDPSVARRLAVHEALTYLRLACKAWRLAPPDWRTRLGRHLTAAERQLSRSGSSAAR